MAPGGLNPPPLIGELSFALPVGQAARGRLSTRSSGTPPNHGASSMLGGTPLSSPLAVWRIMKRILTILTVIYCGCNPVVRTVSTTRQLTCEDIDGLHVTNISAFWQGLEPKIDSGNPSGILSMREGYVCGKRWEWIKPYEGRSRLIEISVFESQSAAVAAMEFRMRNIASATVFGADDGTFSGRWWRGVSSAFIGVNHRNCIIIVNLLNSNFDQYATLLKETASTIISQMDG